MLRKPLLLLVAAVASLGFTGTASAVQVGTFNLKRGKAQVRPFADVIGWQEAEVADTPRIMAKLRGLAGYKTFFPMGNTPRRFSANEVPISYRRGTFDLIAKGKRFAHGGESGITPSRWVAFVVLKNRRTQEQFTFVNTHFINGAFKDKFANRQHRLDLWNTHLGVLQDQIAKLRAQYGSPVIVTGDFNRPDNSPLPGVKRIDGPGSGGSIDQIYAEQGIPTGPATRRARWGSDHYAWSAKVLLKQG